MGTGSKEVSERRGLLERILMSQLSAIPRIGQLTLSPLGGISFAGLACLKDPNHEAMALTEVICHGRPDPKFPPGSGVRIACERQEKLTVPLFFQMLVSCDNCRQATEKLWKMDSAKIYWESICDETFRDTDKNHPGFPKSQYEVTKDYLGTESLMFLGPTGKGKSRLAMMLLKRCLIRCDMHVGVLWPEELSAVKGARGRETLDMIGKWGKYDLLLMDDSISAGAQDSRVTDFLKQLLDYRMRHKRHQIVTSQIGSVDYQEHRDKNDNQTKTDKALVEALLRRFKEVCRQVMFDTAVPGHGQESF